VSTNYTGDPSATQSPGPTPGPGVIPIMNLPADGDPLAAASVAQAFKESADYIAYIQTQQPGSPWGDGTDGSFTFDGVAVSGQCTGPSGNVYTLIRDVTFSAITINNGITLETGGFRLWCTGQIQTVGTGAITNKGANASGGTGGAGAAQQTVSGGGAGGASAAAGTSTTNTIGSGNGGAGGGGGGAGSSNTPAATNKGRLHTYSAMTVGALVSPVQGINPVGGGGGGGGGANNGGTGGGGGGGGGVLCIMASKVRLATASNLSAKGGNGANGSGANSSGGGGGGGGLLLLHCATLVVDDASSVNAANCCPGGSAGTGVGTGVSGTAGSNGAVVVMTL
jgi:hypothetical protein